MADITAANARSLAEELLFSIGAIVQDANELKELDKINNPNGLLSNSDY